jgi:ATP-dependent RNA helicase RhlE
MQRGSVNFKHLEVLVLDEADRILDMGFIHDIKRIIAALPKQRQTMLFSATISPEINSLAADMLNSPVTIQIGRPRNPIETITQHIYPVSKEQKMDLLVHMLSTLPMYSVLVFSRTKHGADKINHRLNRSNVISVAIHSNRTQNQRLLALDGFKSGKYRVMVATDIAARGIDVTGISHVINYDVPAYAEDYVHRIGRTGRAAATGDAITFVSREEQISLKKIEKFIGRQIPTETCPEFTYVNPPSLAQQPKQQQSEKRQKQSSGKNKSGRRNRYESTDKDKSRKEGKSKFKSNRNNRR